MQELVSSETLNNEEEITFTEYKNMTRYNCF